MFFPLQGKQCTLHVLAVKKDVLSSVCLCFILLFPQLNLVFFFFSPLSVMHTGGSREHTHGVLARVNGPFTPSQWLEFERQALIYKYIVANIAIPPNLLISIRSGFGFPPFSAGYFGSRTCKTSIYSQGKCKEAIFTSLVYLVA